MHIPDGFINAATSAGAGVAAAGGVTVSLRRSAEVLRERTAPLAGLVAAFVFTLQMLNFPVAAGTSGHLLGGVLAAVLVGPWVGSLCVAVVILVQALVFADGGLTALGLNVLNMAFVGALGCYPIFLLVRRLLAGRRRAVPVAAAVAAWFGPVLGAVAFSVEYGLGGNGATSIGRVATAMIGTHMLIGVGEAAITAAVVSAVLAARPDLVRGAGGATGRPAAGRRAVGGFVVAGLAVAAVLVFVVAPHASNAPDGLEKVAAQQGLDTGRRPSATSSSPLAGYSVHARLSAVAAAGLGIVATLAIGGLAVGIARRRARLARPAVGAATNAGATAVESAVDPRREPVGVS